MKALYYSLNCVDHEMRDGYLTLYMKLITFLFSLALFLLYLYKERRRGKKKIIVNSRKEDKSISQVQPKEQHEDFYSSRLNTLQKMLREAIEEEEREERKLNHINELNQYGVVVNEKNIKRVEQELYKARRKRLAIENQIFTTRERRRRET